MIPRRNTNLDICSGKPKINKLKSTIQNLRGHLNLVIISFQHGLMRKLANLILMPNQNLWARKRGTYYKLRNLNSSIRLVPKALTGERMGLWPMFKNLGNAMMVVSIKLLMSCRWQMLWETVVIWWHYLFSRWLTASRKQISASQTFLIKTHINTLSKRGSPLRRTIHLLGSRHHANLISHSWLRSISRRWTTWTKRRNTQFTLNNLNVLFCMSLSLFW